ncbi:tripartite tricarboxylate transporter substrate binding protein [uncultured Oscillibacter sp.]|uniref:Bug family tripartite tricarboxylate transporter substrate binding protein n=1 Tax=uncultured Oscillibacter sp. TaxID=876091 RepID=UPI002629C7BE|nr:tripartite tricarboxylate transporter substrate binding protein [uncultured Oscillibacter sp.]
MKRFFSLVLTCVMLLCLATGCGGGKDDSAQTPPPADNSGSSAPAAGDSSGEAWKPEKTINIYMTHGAGGDTDYMGRQLATALEGVLGVSVVVTNVTGSNGATCMQQYKDGETDGYTLIATNTAALNGNEATSMVDFGYDAFEPVAVYGIQSGENIVVPADAPYDDLQGLLDASKANPGQIRYGISTGGGVYIQACVLTNLGGAQFNIIDAGDGAARLTALLGGEVDATSLPYSTAADYIENGQLKSLCTCLSKAPDLLPDQKSASETIPELQIDTEYVVLAPKGTPANIVSALNAAILEATSTDSWKTMVNEYCLQNPFVLNVEDTVANLKNQRDLFQSFVPFL